jgi:hypothetical protein
MLNRVLTTRTLQLSCFSNPVSLLLLCHDNLQGLLQAIQPMLSMEHILVARLLLSSVKSAMDILRYIKFVFYGLIIVSPDITVLPSSEHFC